MPPSRRGRSRYRSWAFSVEDYAELLDMSVAATRKSLQRRRWAPTDLRSVIAFWWCRSRLAERREVHRRLVEIAERHEARMRAGGWLPGCVASAGAGPS